MKISEIKKLRPTFQLYGGMQMVDWFEVRNGRGWCNIHSGLKHADGVTKSPYHYDHTIVGKNATKECVEHFSEWWENKKIEANN